MLFGRILSGNWALEKHILKSICSGLQNVQQRILWFSLANNAHDSDELDDVKKKFQKGKKYFHFNFRNYFSFFFAKCLQMEHKLWKNAIYFIQSM